MDDDEVEGYQNIDYGKRSWVCRSFDGAVKEEIPGKRP